MPLGSNRRRESTADGARKGAERKSFQENPSGGKGNLRFLAVSFFGGGLGGEGGSVRLESLSGTPSFESEVLMFRMPSDVETTLMEDVMGSSAFVRSCVATSRKCSRTDM